MLRSVYSVPAFFTSKITQFCRSNGEKKVPAFRKEELAELKRETEAAFLNLIDARFSIFTPIAADLAKRGTKRAREEVAPSDAKAALLAKIGNMSAEDAAAELGRINRNEKRRKATSSSGSGSE